MALSIDSIYKPINDFFLATYGSANNESVVFRFDKAGFVVSDEDYLAPNSDEIALKAEMNFSVLVNRIPVEDSDGVYVRYTSSLVDDTYMMRIITPSLPYIPPDTSPDVANSIEEGFMSVKAEAIRRIQMIWKASEGVIDKFWPSTALPGNWYDRNNGEIWQHHSILVEEKGEQESSDKKSELWRLKLDTAAIKHLLEKEDPKIDLSRKVILKKVFLPDAVATVPRRGAALRKFKPGLATHIKKSVADSGTTTEGSQQSNAISRSLIKSLSVRDRLFVKDAISSERPTKPVTTSKVSINFSYCVVQIDRPWMVEAFLQLRNWYIPGITKGELTREGSSGSLRYLPIGFVAIKDLDISANWTDADKENAKEAVDFGPFEVEYDQSTNKLSMSGIQIIGWLLQKLPELPPNQ